jgi:uncharacterized membrane protein HdeD (DUF308 family)
MSYWIALIRGVLAISLGVALLLQPDKTRPMLANFMGMYWMMGGVVSMRLEARYRRRRLLPVLVGVVGILAGLSVLLRKFMLARLPEEIFFITFGLVILLTGLLHVFEGFRYRTEPGELDREWSWTSFFIGVFEVVLGLAMILTGFPGGFVYLAASLWALLAGLLLIGEALRIRRLSRQTERS